MKSFIFPLLPGRIFEVGCSSIDFESDLHNVEVDEEFLDQQVEAGSSPA